MAGNSFGSIFRISTFGESHGEGIGVVIDGCPAGLEIDKDFVQHELNRRKPGQSTITSPRNEEDKPEWLSGIFEGKTTGAPIALFIRNKNQQSSDYAHLKDLYRPSHADYTWEKKFSLRDYRGGGRASARETAARVMAGAIAKLFIRHEGISIHAYVSQVHHIILPHPYTELDLSKTDSNAVRCPDADTADKMIATIEQARSEGDSVGGVICCIIKGCPPGLGEPVFDRINARLAKAMLSIQTCKGFEIGSGFSSASMKGSEHNDAFVKTENKVTTRTNNSGGIQGGLTNGEDIFFRCAFKPVSTIQKKQDTLSKSEESILLEAIGRHDPCVLPRAVPIVEAMAALVIADFILLNRSAKV
jgi:chorismate synthase